MQQNASSLQPVSSTRDQDTSRAFPPRAALALRARGTNHRSKKLQLADEQHLRHQIHTALLFLKETAIERVFSR